MEQLFENTLTASYFQVYLAIDSTKWEPNKKTIAYKSLFEEMEYTATSH